MSILNALTRDLDWRETEIASMRLLLVSNSTSPSQKIALLRAAWAMLYAHYEGFCKNTLIAFYDAICSRNVKCVDLPNPTKVLALHATFKHLRSMTDIALLAEVESFPTTYLDKAPNFPDVDTQSNLWPDVLIGLIESADLSPSKVKEHRVKLSTLVSRRNGIAHGENNIISEFEYYKTFEDAVYDVIYDLAYQVEARLQDAPYASRTASRAVSG